MTIIKIAPNENGSHDSQTINGVTPETFTVPEGYAIIPEEVGTPDTLENYPFGEITVEDRAYPYGPDEVIFFPTVTSWSPLPIPEPEPTEPEEQPHSDMVTPAVFAAARAFVAVATTLTDDQALEVQSLAKTWEQALDEGARLEYGSILRKGDRLYRVAQEGGVMPQDHQPPDAEGVLAVYRPIDKSHTGTLEDPIPWAYGMDCTTGLYYSYTGSIYLCKGDMIPCVWAPDTPGLWQWAAA